MIDSKKDYNNLTTKEFSLVVGMSTQNISHHKRNGKTHNDIVNYLNEKELQQTLKTELENDNSELTAAKIQAQIDALRLQSVERKLKIMQKMNELVSKDKVNEFVLKLSGIMKSSRTIAFSDVPSRSEGLEAKLIGKILIDASKKMDELILKELEQAQKELLENENE